MYLGDIILVAPTTNLAQQQHRQTIDLLQQLRLEVTHRKLETPSQGVKSVGIVIGIEANKLSIPDSKLDQIKTCMAAAAKWKKINKKHL